MGKLHVTVDNRIRMSAAGLPVDMLENLKRSCEYANPDFAKKRAMGFPTYDTPAVLVTWMQSGDHFSLARGAMTKFRTALAAFNVEHAFHDAREEGSPLSKGLTYRGHVLRPYQEEARDAAIATEQGIIRASTGSGKTLTAFALAAKIGLPTLVILPNTKLLDQWYEVAEKSLGLFGREVGLIQGSTRRLKPLTVATQQTLWSQGVTQDISDFFGAVIIDEAHHCFEGSTPVLMADGTLRPIREVREGDVVAIGGCVLSTMRRFYEGPVVRFGDGSVATPEHPFATSEGWRPARSLDTSSDVYYDPLHEGRAIVSHLSEAHAVELQGRDASGVRAEGLSTRRDVSFVRRDRLAEEQGQSPLDEVWNEGAVEQGAYGGDIGRSSAHGGRAARSPEAVEFSRDERAVEGSRSAPRPQRGAIEGTEEAFHEAGRARGERAPREERDRGGEDEGVRRAWAWERTSDHVVGARDGDSSRLGGIRDRTRRADEEEARGGIPDELQDRSRARGGEDRDRDRRDKPPGTRGDRREEDRLPRVDGLVGLPLPGSVRFRRSRANGARSHVDVAVRVYNLETEKGAYVAGGVLVHNCAAKTHEATVNAFPARFRIAFSADETRKDRKECLVYDAFGSVLHETTRADAEASGAVVDVEVRIVPTAFRADWYAAEPDFNRLVNAMAEDPSRNALIGDLVAREVGKGKQAIVLSHRREHARVLDAIIAGHGVRSGCMLGGQEAEDETAFDESRAGLLDGTVDVGVGTYGALGEGIDLPAVEVGVASTPIWKNKQMVNQVRGRLCRPSAGKKRGVLYVLYDGHALGIQPIRNIIAWNRTVTVWHRGSWEDARLVLKTQGMRAFALAS